MAGKYSVDLDGLTCDLGTKRCATAMVGHGGLVEHHEVPKSMGGAEKGLKLTLCPNHHYRVHSLVRYLAQCDTANIPPQPSVTDAFTRKERAVAEAAIVGWHAAGKPSVMWPTPAAR
jgi:hypothetical protein